MWPNPQETVDLVTFTEEILNEKIHFLRSDVSLKMRFRRMSSGVKVKVSKQKLKQENEPEGTE